MFCDVAIDPNQHFVFINTLNSKVINLKVFCDSLPKCLADFWKNQQSCHVEVIEDVEINLLIQKLDLCFYTL